MRLLADNALQNQPVATLMPRARRHSSCAQHLRRLLLRCVRPPLSSPSLSLTAATLSLASTRSLLPSAAPEMTRGVGGTTGDRSPR